MRIPPSRPGPLRPQRVKARSVAQVAARIDAVPATGSDRGAAEQVLVTGVCLDSRAVCAGDLYAAVGGASTHGARFGPQAAAAGAVAILTDAEGAALLAPAGLDLPVLVAERPRARLGELAGWLYGDPADRLLMLGVTGTNGKTTTTYLLDAALRAGGRTTGLIGTVELRAADLCWASVRTTPEATDLHALLALMVERGATVASMEVSSHALAQHRVDGVRFDLVGFTNLSQDHLDFHGSMQRYYEAKAELFTPLRARRGVVCVDDSWGRKLAETAGIEVVTLSTRPDRAAVEADWRVLDAEPDPTGTRFTLAGPGDREFSARAPLPGGFNVANTALALTMLVESGMDAAAAVQALAAAGPVPGRMELVGVDLLVAGQPVGVVDYAHTPVAVAAALAALRPGTAGPLVVVLGAGGDRDRDKRPLMGAAAAALADVVVVTDDNPRTEPAATIRAAVLAGARDAAAGRDVIVLEVAGRRAAVAEAVRLAWTDQGPAGVVLLAGKGHEQGQDAGGRVAPFDDRAVLRDELRAAARRVGSGEPVR